MNIKDVDREDYNLADLPDYLGLDDKKTAILLGMTLENWYKTKRKNILPKTRRAHIKALIYMKEILFVEDFSEFVEQLSKND